MADTLTGERLYTHLEKKMVEAKLAGDMREAEHRQEMINIMRRLKPERVAMITQIPFLKRLDRTKLVPHHQQGRVTWRRVKPSSSSAHITVISGGSARAGYDTFLVFVFSSRTGRFTGRRSATFG